jgi:Xaa-Pro aminopeptidase
MRRKRHVRRTGDAPCIGGTYRTLYGGHLIGAALMLPHESRRTRLIRAFSDTFDALLITRLPNVRYLSGFTGSSAALLVPATGAPVIATDGRYVTQMAQQAPDLECLETRGAALALVEHAATVGLRRLGVEARHVTLALHDSLREAAGERIELVPAGPFVEELRAVKDDAEVTALRTACRITDEAFESVFPQLRPGVTEREIAWQIHMAMRELGASGPAFDSIVGFGPHSAIPHHQPTDRPLADGDLVKFDFGACFGGYHADMTRTGVLGHAADWQRDLHAEVLDVQARSRASCVVGAVPQQLDTAAAAAIEAAGHSVAHGLGHGVGLEIHEEPFLTPESAAPPLVAANVVTIEPGIYLPGRGGVRIEDTMLVAEAGAEPLTTSPRDLFVA